MDKRCGTIMTKTKKTPLPSQEKETSEEVFKFPQKCSFVKYSAANLPSLWGNFKTTVYRNHQNEEHIAMTLGLDTSDSHELPPLVRIHSACFTSEVFGSLKCDCREQLHYALEKIQEEGRGVLIYLFQEGRGIGLGAKIQVYALQEEGLDTVDANTHLGYQEDARSYDCALDMLSDLGVDEVRLLTNNPHKIKALTLGGLKRVDRVPIEVGCNATNHGYLETKRDRMGHLLSTLELKSLGDE